MTRLAPALLAAMLPFCLPGCRTLPSSATLIATPVNAPRFVDARADFRSRFCARYAASSGQATPGCDYWLWRLPDEPTALARDTTTGWEPWLIGQRYRIFIVPGAFGECFGADAHPFKEAAEALQSRGLSVSILPVEGRSGTERNARLIADWLEAHSDATDPLILVGYSKGVADILRYTVDFPEAARRVKAVISIAGATAGTPIADGDAAWFDLTLARLPNAQCAPGDRRVVDDLRHDVRSAWLAQHPLPAHIRYFSVAAFTTGDRMARGLTPAWRKLLAQGVHNDGQVLVRDSVIPGSTLLGFINADHWEAAFPMERRYAFMAGREASTRFPREALFEAVLGTVAESIRE